VPAAAWLNDERLQMGSRIYEDSIRQTYNSVLTILTINDPVSDHEQDDDDSLLEDLDPNEFTIGRTKWPGY
jgi:hypothetical protein